MAQPKFPLYIVSKGRSETRMTSKALELMRVPYFIIIEAQEYAAYAQYIAKNKILVLDEAYKRSYDVFDDLGLTKSTGSGPARNFAWEHSIASGAAWHWVMDDNIGYFTRLHNNERIRLSGGDGFACMESFCLRYTNIAMAGPNYNFFVPNRAKRPPFICNTRIYSCNLIRNNIPFRWRGRYNEDTDLSLRILKSGLCTVLFNAFLQGKAATQSVAGGNTSELYADGTKLKSEMIVAMHPDVTILKWKYKRHHHYVDYRPFRKNKLIRSDAPVVNWSDAFKLVEHHGN